MSAWTYRSLDGKPPKRLFHLVLGSHDGRAQAPIPERSTSPRATIDTAAVDSLKALDPNRPIREADIVRCGKINLLDHLVSGDAQRLWHRDAECLG
jgi:hypothetical protein